VGGVFIENLPKFKRITRERDFFIKRTYIKNALEGVVSRIFNFLHMHLYTVYSFKLNETIFN